MTATVAAPESLASWTVAGLLRDGIDLWVNCDGVIVQHGPEQARARWRPRMRELYVVLRVYLECEVYPRRGDIDLRCER